MTPPDSSYGASHPEPFDGPDRFVDGSAGLPGMLAMAARLLVAAPDDADDAALAAILGRVVVPALGDSVALYDATGAGEFRLAGCEPAGYAPLHRTKQPDEAATEIVVPLGSVAPIGGEGAPAGLLAIGTGTARRPFGAAERSAVEALAALVAARRLARQQALRLADLRQRVEAMARAGRELAHLLNNDLTMPVGVVELLLDRNTAAPDLHEMLQAAAHDLSALERHVRAFHEVMREQGGRIVT